MRVAKKGTHLQKKSRRVEEAVLSGEALLALGVPAAGIEFVAAVASLPGNTFMAGLQESGVFDAEHLVWLSSGKTAAEVAAGAVFAGKNALLSLRGSELPMALDVLSSLPLREHSGILLIFSADDPNAWFSHSLVDSRMLAAAANLPVLEVASPEGALSIAGRAARIAGESGLPVLVRYTAGFAVESFAANGWRFEKGAAGGSRRRPDSAAVPEEPLEAGLHWRRRLDRLREKFNPGKRLLQAGTGARGILAAGFVAQKVLEVADFDRYPFRLLGLENVHPVPEKPLRSFLQEVQDVLVLEDGDPLVETQLRLFVQQHNLNHRISGKLDYTVPRFGELQRWQIEDLIGRWHPGFTAKEFFFPAQEQPDLLLAEGFCRGCDYPKAIDLLSQLLQERGVLEKTLFVTTPGCIARELARRRVQPLIPFTPGSAIAVGAGLAKSQAGKMVLAVLGDTAFFHSGLNGLLDAIYQRADLFVLVLDNGMSAQTGLQPNVGSGKDAFGGIAPKVAIEDLLLAVDLRVEFVSVFEEKKFRAAFSSLLGQAGVRVLIVKIPCYFDGDIVSGET